MAITVTGFAAAPDRGKGLARDLRVRWALEELALPYQMHLLSFAEMKEPAHLARQPFGQIPSFEEDGLVLFESGAIVMHLAERHPGLLPADPPARARAINWMFAAVGTVEPVIIERETVVFLERGAAGYSTSLHIREDRIRARLGALEARLGRADWLDGEFSAGDLMMVSVLQRLQGRIIDGFPGLMAYVERGAARPAFGRAFAAQLAVFEATQA